MSRDKSSTSWAAMRAANGTSSCTTPASSFPDVATSSTHQRPLWKPRGKAVSKLVPTLDDFPALPAEGPAVGQGPTAGGDSLSPTPASPGQQANTHSRTHQHHQHHHQQHHHHHHQQTGFAAQTDKLMRRRSLSAPSLADAVQQPTQHHLYSTVASSRSANNSRSSSVDRSRHKHTEQQQQHHHHHQQQQLQQQHADMQQQGAATGLQLLQECHPWCDAVLLHEVLAAFSGDVPAALESLQQMVAVDAAQCRPGSSCSEASCSEDNSSSSSATERVSCSTAAEGTSLAQNWPAGPEDEQGLQETQQLQQLQLGDLKTREYSVRGQQPQHSNQQHQQQQERQQQQQLGQQQHEVGVKDTYHALRGDAVKLSHKYRKASKRAAAARARGDFSAAAQLAAEAVSLKAAADAAHAAAALKIEVANNADNPDGLWELDLHGLHVNEALAALQERVQLLQDIAQDLRKQMSAQQQLQHEPRSQVHKHAPGGTGTLQGLVAASNGASSTKQAVLTSLLLSTDSLSSWEQQLSAMRQELRVIVGKGLHSSGGEASLPRIVEQWLLQHGYRYVWRGGCIGVNLKLL